jgi:type I restriction enzyme S subunit
MFGNQIVPLPPPDEQAAIVRFLDHANRKIDGFIRAKRKLIGLLNEQKQAIIHRTVTRGLDPDVPLIPSGISWLGDIPRHWEVLPLGRVLTERKESNYPVKTKNILSLSLHDGVVPYAERTRPGGNKAKEDLTAYKLAYPGDIVVNSMNVVVGSVGLSRYFGAVSPVYYMLRPRQTTDHVEYFDSVFRDVSFQRSLFGLGNGIMVIQSKSTGKLNTIRMRIPMRKLNRVEIPYPPPSEQKVIIAGLATEIAPVNTAIARTEREIALMQEYRTRLTADVVTGKLDVRAAAEKLPDLTDQPQTNLDESSENEEVEEEG